MSLIARWDNRPSSFVDEAEVTALPGLTGGVALGSVASEPLPTYEADEDAMDLDGTMAIGATGSSVSSLFNTALRSSVYSIFWLQKQTVVPGGGPFTAFCIGSAETANVTILSEQNGDDLSIRIRNAAGTNAGIATVNNELVDDTWHVCYIISDGTEYFVGVDGVNSSPQSVIDQSADNFSNIALGSRFRAAAHTQNWAGFLQASRVYDSDETENISAIVAAMKAGAAVGPTIDSATINSDGDQVTFTGSENLAVGAGGNAGFVLTLSGGATTLAFNSISDDDVIYDITNRIVGDTETGTAAYTQPGDGIEADSGGDDVANISGLAITNDSTQDVVAPLFNSNPAYSNRTATSIDIDFESNESGSVSVLVTAWDAAQPNNAAFDSGSDTASITADTPETISLTGLTAGDLYNAWVEIQDGAGNRTVDNVLFLLPHSGSAQFVQLASVNGTASNRLTATPDIAIGDYIDVVNVVGGGSVTINDDATFSITGVVTSFDFYVGDETADGYGSPATQTVAFNPEVDTSSPGNNIIYLDSDPFLITFTEDIYIGTDGLDGLVGVSDNFSNVTFTLVDTSGTTLTVTPSRLIGSVEQESITLSYTQPGDGLKDVDDNLVASFSGIALLNLSEVVHFGDDAVDVDWVASPTITRGPYTVAVSGPGNISASNCEYSINGGSFVTSSGTISDGDTITIRVTTPASYAQTVNASVTIDTTTSPFVVSTPLFDAVPDSFTFTDSVDDEISTSVESNVITVSGVEPGEDIAISISNGEYRVDSGGGFGAYTSSPSTVQNGYDVQVRVTSSASYETTVNATLNISGVTDIFSVTTRAQDVTPNAFDFTDLINQAVDASVDSNTITITGIDDGAAISVSGGQYSIDSGGFTSSPGTINNGQTLALRVTTSSENSTEVEATVDVGDVSVDWSVTTVAETGIININGDNNISPGEQVSIDSAGIDFSEVKQIVLDDGENVYPIKNNGTSNITIPPHIPSGSYTLKVRLY